MLNGFKNIQNNHFLVNPDEEQNSAIRSKFKMEEEENILLVIDDTFLTNLKKTVVFTNKKIYWNMKNVHTQIKKEDSFSVINGSGSIDVKELNTASIYGRKTGTDTVINIISKNIQISFLFRNCTNIEALKIVFFDYINNYSGGYAEDKIKNEEVYRKFLKENRVQTIYIVSTVFEICNIIGILFLVVKLCLSLILKRDIMSFIYYEQVIVLTLTCKFLSILSGNRKSVSLIMLMIILFSYMMLIPELRVYTDNIYFILGYACLNMLLSILDFDKVFKIMITILAVLSLLGLLCDIFFKIIRG